MKVLIDTNILFSALVFPNSVPAKALLHVVDKHCIVLCEQNLSEIRRIVREKVPNKIDAIESLLSELPYELVPTIHNLSGYHIRDAKDQPILNSAILADVDMILTGDKDFLCLDIDRPRCISASQYLEEYN